MDLSEARAIMRTGGRTARGDEEEAANAMADALGRIENLCNVGMSAGTPWWVFRDAVREILKG